MVTGECNLVVYKHKVLQGLLHNLCVITCIYIPNQLLRKKGEKYMESCFLYQDIEQPVFSKFYLHRKYYNFVECQNICKNRQKKVFHFNAKNIVWFF